MLTYQLFDLEGELIEETNKPIGYIHGGFRGIFESVEIALEGKKIGDKAEIKLEPDEAFGDYDENLVHIEPIDKFPKNVEVGMQFEGHKEKDEGGSIYRVTDIADGKVVVDGNHPLAGIGLLFSCTIADIRAASTKEVSDGHIHSSSQSQN